MLGWALTFLIVAIVAAYLGFFALAGVAASIAKGVFLIFLALLILGAARQALQGRPPV